MAYSIERLKTYPAVLLTLDADFKIPGDVGAYMHEANAILDAETAPIAVIVDFRQFSLSLDGLLQGTKISLDPTMNIAKHPKVGKMILVTHSILLKTSLDGLRKLGLANDIRAVASLEDAYKQL